MVAKISSSPPVAVPVFFLFFVAVVDFFALEAEPVVPLAGISSKIEPESPNKSSSVRFLCTFDFDFDLGVAVFFLLLAAVGVVGVAVDEKISSSTAGTAVAFCVS